MVRTQCPLGLFPSFQIQEMGAVLPLLLLKFSSFSNSAEKREIPPSLAALKPVLYFAGIRPVWVSPPVDRKEHTS